MQDVIQTSRDRGMFTLDDHLALLVKRGVIEREVALAFCLDPPSARVAAALTGLPPVRHRLETTP